MAHKNRIGVLLLEYCAVLFGFFLMYFFIWPQSDVFLFARETDDSFLSAFEFSLNYGNGRFLGNLIGVYFSTHFEFAGIITAVVLCAIVFLLNTLLFQNSSITVFPLAFLIALPSTGLVKECYYLFAGFCNYVIPVGLLLFSLLLLRFLHTAKELSAVRKAYTFLLLFVCSVSSCLFSENTSIVALAIALALLLYTRMQKASTFPQWLYLLSVVIGTVIMFLIPVLTGTGEKMDGYRQISSGLSGTIRQCVVSFATFANVFNHWYLLLFALSFGFILLCRKQAKGFRFFKPIQLTIFSVYPFLCLAFNSLDSHSILASQTMLNLINAALAFVYICNILITLVFVEDKAAKIKYWLLTGVTFFSIAPMMVVSISGHRTYYITFFCLIVYSFILIKDCISQQLTSLTSNLRFLKLLAAAAACCFALISVFLLMQSLFNYDFYVIRSNYMAEKINSGEILQVPLMPCDAISIEDPLESTLFFAFQSDPILEQTVISLSSWELFETYYDNVVNNPIQALAFALENWQYKDPLYPESLCQ